MDKNVKNTKNPGPETVSRFACRIYINRSNPHIAKIYAGGFDSNKNIFLGVGIYFFKNYGKYFFYLKRKMQLNGKPIRKLSMVLQQMEL